jgi:CO/xanthine dehydrogenase FAD-binding subunit
MKPARFRYANPKTLNDALSLRAEYEEESRFLAGGQSLLPTMAFRLAQPEILIDLNGLHELNYVRQETSGAIRIGATVRHREMQVNKLIIDHQPLVNEAMFQVAHQQIRNRGTLCGNLAHADPSSEMPAVMLALEARFHAKSVNTDRWVDAADFFLGVFETALVGPEMLIEVELPPMAERTGTSFIELSRRPGDYAMMGVAAVLTLGDDGTCANCRLAFCNASETAVLTPDAMASLVGKPVNEETARAVADIVQTELDPPDNINASSAYKTHLAGVLTRRTLLKAAKRASGAAEVAA